MASTTPLTEQEVVAAYRLLTADEKLRVSRFLRSCADGRQSCLRCGQVGLCRCCTECRAGRHRDWLNRHSQPCADRACLCAFCLDDAPVPAAAAASSSSLGKRKEKDDQKRPPKRQKRVDVATMSVFVKTLTGATHTLTVGPKTSIQELRERIKAVSGVPVDQQTLIHAGRKLEEEQRTLEAYGIPHQGTVHMVISLRGS